MLGCGVVIHLYIYKVSGSPLTVTYLYSFDVEPSAVAGPIPFSERSDKERHGDHSNAVVFRNNHAR